MFTARVVKNPKTAVLELHICQTPKPITVVERSWNDMEGEEVERDEEGSKKKTLMRLLEADLNIPFNEKPDGPNDLIRVSYAEPVDCHILLTCHLSLNPLRK